MRFRGTHHISFIRSPRRKHMGSLDSITDFTDLIHILVGLLKGDASVLSTDGSIAGSFGGEGLGSSTGE
jgi:hypothetical protein